MIEISHYINRIKIGLAAMLLAGLTGCVGYADVGYGGAVVAPGPDVNIYGPDVGFYGGFSDRGRDVHAFRDRGFASRGIAHPGGRGGRR
jgi:hypothetical protein